MPLFKSRSLAFIFKLVLVLLLIPGSYIFTFQAASLGGYGWDGFLILIAGPIYTLLAMLQSIFKISHSAEVFILWEGVVWLYAIYALLFRTVKSKFVVPLILLFHITLSVVGMVIHSILFLKYSNAYWSVWDDLFMGLTELLIFFSIPLGLGICILGSIRKSSTAVTEGKPKNKNPVNPVNPV